MNGAAENFPAPPESAAPHHKGLSPARVARLNMLWGTRFVPLRGPGFPAPFPRAPGLTAESR